MPGRHSTPSYSKPRWKQKQTVSPGAKVINVSSIASFFQRSAHRIAAFIVVPIIAMLASFLYQRFLGSQSGA